MQISLALDGQTPARVLGEGVQHVVQEADARVHADGLGLAGLGGVAAAVLGEQPRVRVRGKRAAVEVEGELDLCLVGVAGEGGPALGLRGLFGAHCAVRCGAAWFSGSLAGVVFCSRSSVPNGTGRGGLEMVVQVSK